jgi:hypothetical protein
MANNIVYVSENDTHTSVAFKPSEFKFAEIGPKTIAPNCPDNPCVIIWLSDPVMPSTGTSVASFSYPVVFGGTGMTSTQAQTALQSVYTAVDAYYTSLVS